MDQIRARTIYQKVHIKTRMMMIKLRNLKTRLGETGSTSTLKVPVIMIHKSLNS